MLGDGGDQAMSVETRRKGGAALERGLVGGGGEHLRGHGRTYGAPSPNLKHWIKKQVTDLDAWARPWAQRGRLNGWAYEFLLFGLKQAWACLFGGLMLALILGTHLLWPLLFGRGEAPLARYDFLVLASVAIQVALLALKLERWDEALVIGVFHVVGTVMEVFKTAHGAWIYPEPGLLKIAGVPLFSGFMYACIGSYIARVWRLMDLRFTHYPPVWTTWALAILAYLNFFTHHYGPDIRIGLFAASAVLFGRTWVAFTSDRLPPSHAPASGLWAGGPVHLAGREPRHPGRRLGLSQPA